MQLDVVAKSVHVIQGCSLAGSVGQAFPHESSRDLVQVLGEAEGEEEARERESSGHARLDLDQLATLQLAPVPA